VSMRWGFSEASGETAFQQPLTRKGSSISPLPANSPGALHPSASPNVVAVGGTSLVRNPLPWRGSLGDFQGEVVWNWGPSEGTGGGPSLYEPRPAYQFLVKNIVGSSRGTPDVAAVADLFTGCGSTTRTFRVGSPLVEPAFPPRYGRASSTRRVGSTTPRGRTRPNLCKRILVRRSFPGFTDITSGACSIGPDFEGLLATKGWDFCSGVGSPLGYFGK
jgi:hypothetical protein